MNFIKSPLNHIGNKFQIIDQLLYLFPSDIDTLYDFFSGGADVTVNASAKRKIGIEINTFLTDILHEFQNKTLEEILDFIEKRIKEFDLSKTNEDGYLKYRDAYNNDPNYHTPLDLFTLSRYSFHFTMRFSSDLKMNAGFGRGYSNFSTRQRKNIVPFHAALQNITIINDDFRNIKPEITPNNFFYFDPPYLITNNVYNHGATEANQRWTEVDEKYLLDYISKINESGGHFALSNVITHHGKTNTLLSNWIEKNNFNVHDIVNKGYSHCTHTAAQDVPPTREIVVTNY